MTVRSNKNSAPGSFSFAFDIANPSVSNICGDIDDYFKNDDALNAHGCPMSSCSVMASGCATVDTSGYFTVDTAINLFAIKAARNIHPGYTVTICVQCTNGVQTISEDGVVITLAPDPCLTSLST